MFMAEAPSMLSQRSLDSPGSGTRNSQGGDLRSRGLTWPGSAAVLGLVGVAGSGKVTRENGASSSRAINEIRFFLLLFLFVFFLPFSTEVKGRREGSAGNAGG